MTNNDVIEVEIDPKIFNPVYIPLLQDMSRVQILYGGASSGKSKFKAQQVLIDVLSGGRNYLICRQVAKTLRRSVFNEIKKVILEFGVTELFKVNKTELTFTCVNGYQILLAGLDDVEKIKSITPEKGALTDIWVEEATETEQNDIKALMKRQRGGDEKTPKRLHMTFNPIYQEHWIFKEYFLPIGWTDEQTEYHGDGLSILKTWYIHNRWLTRDDVNDLLKETDKYYRSVYTFGNWGVLGNVIFTNWVVADLNDPASEYYLPENQRTNRFNGLDFGFASNPAAAGRSHYDKTRLRIYVFDELYETGLTNDLLAEDVKRMIGGELITCDSAEPKSIQELRNFGVNAVGAKKGKDSVTFGIQWLQRHTIIIDKKCVNAANEMRTYKWKEGADGKPVSPPKPLDKNNHFIDGGLRYAYESEMNQEGVSSEPNPFYD